MTDRQTGGVWLLLSQAMQRACAPADGQQRGGLHRHHLARLLTRRARNALGTATQSTRGKHSPPPPGLPTAAPRPRPPPPH
jgi:hypothetical protein